MKFVHMFWCNVWVCEIDIKWIVDDEITCSKHAYMYTLHFHLKWMRYDVVVDGLLWNHVNCCCCCWEMLLLMIETLGDHNHWDLLRIGVFLWVFTKMGQKGVFGLKDVLAQISYGFESLLVSENVWVNLGIKFGLGGFKIGILGWRMRFSWQLTVSTRHGE